MDDGVLNTLVVQKVTRRAFIRFVGPYSKGEYYKFPHLAQCYTPKVVRITSEKPDIVTCLDGETSKAARSRSASPTRSSTSSAPRAAAATRQRGEGEFDHFVNFWFFSEIPLAKSE